MSIDLKHGKFQEVLPTIKDKSIDLVLVDIPYEIARETNFKSIKDFTKKEGETEYSCMNFGEWDKDFDIDLAMKESIRVVKEGRSVIFFCAWQQLEELRKLYVKYLPKKLQREPRIGVWEKSNPSVFNMQRMAIQPFEFFIWFGIGSNVIFNNQNEGKPERHYFRTATQRGFHPTLKPVEIMNHLIKTYTNEGDTVLDFTMGSGTTMISCVDTNRDGIGIEIELEHFNTSKKRVEEKRKEKEFNVVTSFGDGM